MKIYLLYNGVKVNIMAVGGHDVSSNCTAETSARLRKFFNEGPRKGIQEVTIRPEAVETIVRAIAAHNNAPVPLVSALQELINFCRDQGCESTAAGVAQELRSPDLLGIFN